MIDKARHSVTETSLRPSVALQLNKVKSSSDIYQLTQDCRFEMKIKTISRTEEDYTRKSKHDITKVHRNRDPLLHPFERAREYTKAVVATKLDKIFAKPFIGALDGHTDGVYC